MRKRECEACRAKEQTITALAEQIDWLRMQLGTPWLERRKSDLESSKASYNTFAAWESDEESDIKHMESQGLIAPDAARAALEQIGAFSTDIHVES